MRAKSPVGTLPSGNAASRFFQASDGVNLHYLCWSGGQAEQPLAVLIFLHGWASHGAWFSETATDLRDSGIAVYAPDRRGSGLSGGLRGHLAGYSRALDDVTEMISVVAAECTETPVFLAASSWAAKLAVVYAALRPAPLSGLLLLGPGLFPRVSPSLSQKVAVLVGHKVAPTAYVPIPLTPELYTTTPRYLDFIRDDPLRLLTATTRFFWETRRLDRLRPQASARLRLPLLVLLGEQDAMMDVAKTRHWFSQLGVDDKTYVAYAGAGHTLDFEPDRAQYLADLVGWLSSRAAAERPGGWTVKDG
jgi:alpha-beta hydrolase superfamily lysophospholipase